MVGAVHQQQGIAGVEEGIELLDQGGEPAHQRLGVLGQGGTVAVAGHQVLGPHARSVGRLPPEGGAIDGGRHAPPDHGVLEAGRRQDLGHLGDVAEHVGQVAHVHHAAEVAAPADAGLQVPDDGLARYQELVHQDVPRTDGDPPGGGQRPQPVGVLGTDLQVVVDHRQLPVEEEVGVRDVLLHLVEQGVDGGHQLEPEYLERARTIRGPSGCGGPRRWIAAPRSERCPGRSLPSFPFLSSTSARPDGWKGGRRA